MTDQEIRERLLQADALLQQYVELVQPVADALAQRHDAATGTKHTGKLGCYEEGLNTICLHIVDGEMHPKIEDDQIWIDSMDALREQFFAGLQHVSLDAFF